MHVEINVASAIENKCLQPLETYGFSSKSFTFAQNYLISPAVLSVRITAVSEKLPSYKAKR
jgi:hypothetical protein